METTSANTAGTRTLVVVRHAPHLSRDGGRTYQMTTEGYRLVQECADLIQARIGRRQVHILSSGAARAINTAQELGERLGAELQVVQWLSPQYHAPDIRSSCLIALGHQPPDDVLVLVTHEPQIYDLTGSPNTPFCIPIFEEITL